MEAVVYPINGIVREFERRILNNFLDLLILSALYSHGGQISGYDVIKFLQRNYGFLSSPGTVYSCLYHMERKGLLRGIQKGRKRVYTLTEHGAETTQAIFKAKERIMNFVSMILNKNGKSNYSLPQLLPHFSSKESSPDT
ncbi:MAG: PadR family transcriptional regulator [Nitrososphaerota archaeon]|nr:PadR family transcriptional regulator [Candidatus Bathyarchaeota archaeon]MDW8024003.1 PadR family transcriptional regulator [Nitrososphaerota archaeon]